jgi:hypothetical protein
MFYNIKMKFLIGGKSRSIYMRKDGSAYYKSGGENVDVSYMFKKNGGGLKKQYIGGVQDNLGKVEQKKKRLKRNYNLVLGGVTNEFQFPKIEIISSNIVPDDNVLTNDSIKEFKELCRFAMFGAYSVYNKKISSNIADDNIRIEGLKDDSDLTSYKTANRIDISDYATNGITSNAADNITVSRGYILNKVLGCFSTRVDVDKSLSNNLVLSNTPTTYVNGNYALCNVNILSNLDTTPEFMNKDDFGPIVNKINDLTIKTSVDISDLSIDSVKNIKNIHGILFNQEKIGIRK